MIICNIKDSERYKHLSPLIDEAIDWLLNTSYDELAPGSYPIGDAGVVVKAETPALRQREVAQLEVHRRFIDIHVPIKGIEIIGWAALSDLVHEREAYDEDKDIAFYGDLSASLLHVHPGQMAIFFPEDAHAPNIGLGNHRKLCIKIPV